MYKMIHKDRSGMMQYQVDQKIFNSKESAKNEQQVQLAKIQIALLQEEKKREAEFRKSVGLTLLENDAKVIHESIMEAVIILALCHETGKTKSVTDEAALRVANTRIMHDSVCKRIFKVCLKHGLKSEHLK